MAPVHPGAGPAPHLAKNYIVFTSVLLLSLALAALAVVSKMERRKVDGSPLPWYSLGMCGVCVVLVLALVTGLLGI